MTVAIAILFLIAIWDSSVMSTRTKDLYSKIEDLENRIDEFEDKN